MGDGAEECDDDIDVDDEHSDTERRFVDDVVDEEEDERW